MIQMKKQNNVLRLAVRAGIEPQNLNIITNF